MTKTMAVVLVLAMVASCDKSKPSGDEAPAASTAKGEGSSGHKTKRPSPSGGGGDHGDHGAKGDHGDQGGHGETSAASEGHGGKGEKSAGAEAHGERRQKPRFRLPFVPDMDATALRSTRRYLHELVDENNGFVLRTGKDYFQHLMSGQKPRVTMVTCSDSRVQSVSYDTSPENDVFTIRDIGNLVETAQGSVEYGVHHLKTPLLMILGHTRCGAVKAAMGDTSSLSPAIKREVHLIHVPQKWPAPDALKPDGGKVDENARWLDGVIDNVDDQVHHAMEMFGNEVEDEELTIVGAVYDLANDMKHGYGKITLVNVNGFTDKARVEAFEKAIQEPVPAGYGAGR